MSEQNFLKEINGKHINFLIGSGINVPIIPTLSLGKLKYSLEDIITHESIVEESDHYKILLAYFYIKTINPSFVTTETIEESLGNKYQKFLNLILYYLSSQSNDTPKRVNIFTTNYDLMFENTFDQISKKNSQVNFNDGSFGFINRYISSDRFHIKSLQSGVFDRYSFEIPMINLIKLHGSLSWNIKEERIKVDYNNNPLEGFNNILQEINIIKRLDNLHDQIIEEKVIDKLIEDDPLIYNFDDEKFTINIQEYYTRSITAQPELLNLDYTLEEAVEFFTDEIESIINDLSGEINLNDFYEIFKSLVIVSPTNKKFYETVFQQHYYQMLRILSQELERKQSVLIVFGFSFKDKHILDIVRRSAFNSELMIYIISYNEHGTKEVKKMFSEYNNIKYFPTDFDNTSGNFDFLLSLLEGVYENE